LRTRGESFENTPVTVSGSGNVAQFAVEKLNELGAKVITMSDSSGTIVDNEGINSEKLNWIKELKNKRRGRIKEYAQQFPGSKYLEGKRPWSIPCKVAMPCAIENEISAHDARQLLDNGCICVTEAANMPTVPEGVSIFQQAKILFGPGKAANAGGVATSGLEMSQNASHLHWTREEVDTKLKGIMGSIHSACVEHGTTGKHTDYVLGANIAGFLKVANAMMDQGIV